MPHEGVDHQAGHPLMRGWEHVLMHSRPAFQALLLPYFFTIPAGSDFAGAGRLVQWRQVLTIR